MINARIEREYPGQNGTTNVQLKFWSQGEYGIAITNETERPSACADVVDNILKNTHDMINADRRERGLPHSDTFPEAKTMAEYLNEYSQSMIELFVTADNKNPRCLMQIIHDEIDGKKNPQSVQLAVAPPLLREAATDSKEMTP